MNTLLRTGLPCLLALTLLAACSEEEADGIRKAAPAGKLSAETLRGLTLDTVQLAPVRQEISLTGRVALNADKTVPVYALAGGVVRQVPVSLGDAVRPGQVLAVIHSPHAADREQQQTSAQLDLTAARQQLTTAESLHQDGLLADRDLTQARLDLTRAEQEIIRQRKQSAVYGPRTADATYELRAPLAGFITAKDVTAGTQLTAASPGPLFTVSNLDQVWVLADVFQNDLAKIKVGQAVDVTTLAYPNQHFSGTIDKVYNLLHAESKTLKVRVSLPNPGYRLKPGMHAVLKVQRVDAAHPQLTVPAASVVFANDRRYVLVLRDATTLEAREVQLLHSAGGWSYVQTGVVPGEQVVTRNALLLYKALND